MEIILNTNCTSITGTLGTGFGYSLQRRKNRFFGVRNSRGFVPPDGHWRFILACAELARLNLNIAQIRVPADELHDALLEAHRFIAANHLRKLSYNAADIINLKHTFGL